MHTMLSKVDFFLRFLIHLYVAVVAVFQMNDGLVCSGGMDKTVRIWNIRTGSNMKTFTGHNDSIFNLFGLADGRLVSGSADCTLRVWNLITSKCEMIINGHTNAVQFSLLLWDGTICTASRYASSTQAAAKLSVSSKGTQTRSSMSRNWPTEESAAAPWILLFGSGISRPGLASRFLRDIQATLDGLFRP